MKLQATLALIASSVLMGCQSTSEPIEPRPFTNANSYAYNIANQTLLTRNNSPLKDFTPEEIEDARTKMVKASGGEASVVLGGIGILTGNLIDIISVAGGAAGYLAHSDHEAAETRFIIVLPKEKFASKGEAISYIKEVTSQAAHDALSKYGEITSSQVVNDRFTFLSLNGLPMGPMTKNASSENLLQESVMIINDRMIDAYTYGVERDTRITEYTLVTPPTPLPASIGGNQDIDYSQFFKDYTAALPQGFFIYTPSFPVAEDGTYTYSDFTQVVPAIYTQGEKYEFIKPE